MLFIFLRHQFIISSAQITRSGDLTVVKNDRVSIVIRDFHRTDSHVCHLTDNAVDIHFVAHTDRAIGQHEEAGKQIGSHTLRAHTDSDGDNTSRSQHRRGIHAEHIEDGKEHDNCTAVIDETPKYTDGRLHFNVLTFFHMIQQAPAKVIKKQRNGDNMEYRCTPAVHPPLSTYSKGVQIPQ